jgi:tRNA 2-selenouridine synthase
VGPFRGAFLVEESRRLIVLAGLAGSGKTELLHRLASHGEAVVDLENLAAHRGSAFGGLGRPPQPSPKEFAMLVDAAWRGADPARVLWIEDEGPFIGSVGLPAPLLQQICTAPVVEVEAPLPDRVTRLTAAYDSIPIRSLIGALESAAPRLGVERTRDRPSIL